MQMLVILPSYSYINLHKGYKKLPNGDRTMQGENRNDVKFGFTPGAENLNGRLAMIGFVAALITEFVTGQGVLHFLGLI